MSRPDHELITIDRLIEEGERFTDLILWPRSRLGLYAHRLPLLLLAGCARWPNLDSYPRAKGPHVEADLEVVERWSIRHQVATSLIDWMRLAVWADEVFYPAYAERHLGVVHACWERVEWLRAQLTEEDLPPVVWPAEAIAARSSTPDYGEGAK
jgi:hypothetical protein